MPKKPTAKRKPAIKHPSENEIQAAYFRWVNVRMREHPELALIHSVPNGSNKSPRSRKVFKETGLKSGVPDVVFPFADEDGGILYIEFKSKTGRVSDEQKEWHRRLRFYGNRVEVCRDWADAANKTLEHLGEEPEFDEGT